LDVFFEALKIINKKYSEVKNQLVEANFSDKFQTLDWKNQEIIYKYKLDMSMIQKPQEKLVLDSDIESDE